MLARASAVGAAEEGGQRAASVAAVGRSRGEELPASESAGVLSSASAINHLFAHDPACRGGDGSARLLENRLLGGRRVTLALITSFDICEQRGGNFRK